MVFQEKIKTLSKEFFKNPPDGRGHGLKYIKSKNNRIVTRVSAVFHGGAETPKPKTRCIFKAFKVHELSWV